MSIAMFRPVYDVDACLDGIRDCLEKGWTGQGYKTIEFEDAWKNYTGLPFAHFVTTGSAALNLAVETLKEECGWEDGDEIISTPLTFVATNNAILFSRLTPVFADVDDALCLDPVSVEERITERTRAVIFVGVGGNAGALQSIAAICRERGLKLILDAAHMAGTRLNGVHVGMQADATAFSFHVTKNLSLAEGGMLCFADSRLDAVVRCKTFNGIDKSHAPMAGEKHNKWEYDVKYLADAYNGNSVIASIGLAQLPHLDGDNARRREISARYDRAFEGAKDFIGLVPVPEGCESARWLYQIVVEDRDGLMAHLLDKGIGCGIHYPSNTLYKMYSSQRGTCPHAEWLSDHLLTLPLHLLLADNDVDLVIAEVLRYLRG